MAPTTTDAKASPESFARLFLRFLRFGSLAWGGPVAQIAMIRRELVDELRWISSVRFNRVLAVYQALPGPEAHELCVYFGMLQRGRLGGFLAGLGFMLPGLILMLLMSWLYVAKGALTPFVAALFYGAQPAIAAAVVRAVHRLSKTALTDRWLFAIGVAAAISALIGTNFLLVLAVVGLTYTMASTRPVAAATTLTFLVCASLARYIGWSPDSLVDPAADVGGQIALPSVAGLLLSGLKAGLLTFGGAYTVIPFLELDAVGSGGWMTAEQFLDGLAISGVLPAPLVIFGTFVGFVGAGFLGALAMTAGIFVPAFAFTLVGHEAMERLISHERLHTILSGVTAGVIGLMAITAIALLRQAIHDVTTAGICAVAILALFTWHSRWAIVTIVTVGASLGATARFVFQ